MSATVIDKTKVRIEALVESFKIANAIVTVTVIITIIIVITIVMEGDMHHLGKINLYKAEALLSAGY